MLSISEACFIITNNVISCFGLFRGLVGCFDNPRAPALNKKGSQPVAELCQKAHLPHGGAHVLLRNVGLPNKKAGASPCVRTVSKLHLFWPLGLAFERKADTPGYCKQIKIEGSDGDFGAFSTACKARVLREGARFQCTSLRGSGRTDRVRCADWRTCADPVRIIHQFHANLSPEACLVS